ncbi:NUDIX domain-containing protein [Streptomyces sp. NPDC004732]|uniref:NUDIX domain-containing protein n=1 Tax=Streptomyces sp. NPDC004732 TaxID=3154290 RepID=UPI0033A58769
MSLAIRNSAKAVILHNGQVLLLQAIWNGSLGYFLPGGGQKPGETLEEAVIREVREETGLDVDVVRLLWVREYIGPRHPGDKEEADTHRVDVIFLCRPVGKPGTLGGHAEDEAQIGFEWAAPAHVPQLAFHSRALATKIAGLTDAGGDNPYVGETE